MKRRIIKGLVMTMVTVTLLTGCGKEEQANSQNDAKVNDSINIEKDIDDNGVINENDTSQNKMEALVTWEDISNYQVDKIAGFMSAADKSGLEYDIAHGNVGIHGEYKEDVLEKTYTTEFIALSLTDYPNKLISTQMEFECEYHPDKGIADNYIELLYGFIQATDEKELKEMMDSVDTLKAKLEEGIQYTGQKCTLKINPKYSATTYLNFVYKSYESITIEEEEKVFTEFASLDEYEKLWEALEEEEFSKDRAFDKENNLAIGFDLRAYVQKLNDGNAKYNPEEIVEKLDEYFNMTDLLKERLSNEIALWSDIETWNCYLLDGTFSDEPCYVQYPNEFMTQYDKLFYVFPVKVEGLLNK